MVGNMQNMSLFRKTCHRPSHGDHIVIGVRAEYDHTFGIGEGSFGTGSIVCIGFPPRPSGNGMLQEVERVYVDLAERTALGDQVAHSVVVVIPCG